jgi:epsilon-lactone hydrolase
MMASLIATLFSGFFRTTGLLKRGFAGGPNFEQRIRLSRKVPVAVPTARMRAKFAVTQRDLDGRQVWTIAPKDAAPSAHMLYFHGGGYVASPVGVHWDFLAKMVSDHGFAITAPLYPLAPEVRADDITAFGLKIYQQFIDGHDGPFLMGGDSAGGGLTAAVAHAARDAGLRGASGLVLICPWLDVEAGHADQAALEKRDIILSIDGIRRAGLLYAGDLLPTDPRVSPIYADWNGLPPILCFGGGDDILVTDARALKAKKPEIEYIEQAGLMHVWPIFPFSDARPARQKMADFAELTAAG